MPTILSFVWNDTKHEGFNTFLLQLRTLLAEIMLAICRDHTSLANRPELVKKQIQFRILWQNIGEV